MTFCGKCGAKNPDDADFCFRCGGRLLHEEASDAPKATVTSETPKVEVRRETPTNRNESVS